MTSLSEAPYIALGGAISAARQAAGFATQADLAAALRVSQQSVSRWEAGTHRPRGNQLAVIAQMLELDLPDLRQLAGDFAPLPGPPAKPFPTDQLSPEQLEQFSAHLMSFLHPDAREIARAGGQGHTQDGIDVDVVLADGRRLVLQCKRASRFGPADVNQAAAALQTTADEKMLVLSRVASPQAREEARRLGWVMLDKDDISRLVRTLPIERQEQLVDLYFKGQRLALLGRSEPGPWLTARLMFRPNESRDVALSHSWELLGREAEFAELNSSVSDAARPLTVLVAPGGMGKSRLLKELADQFEEAHPQTTLRFLSGTTELKRSSLEDLGPGPKLLVVDDAHDRDGLGVLFEFAGAPANQTRLLLATRPYAEERLKGEAARYNLTDSKTIHLTRLSRDQQKQLAEQVLEYHGQNANLADYVVAAAGDSPLVVAMAAQVIAKGGTSLELAKNHEQFRNVVLGRFAEVVAGNWDQRGEGATYRSVLEVLALVQPFHPGDGKLLDLISRLKGISVERAAEALRRFTDGGVIFRRGHKWRLMPDVLGDYVIETSCLDATGSLSPFAGELLSQAQDPLLKNAITNLGRLDWRREDGDTSNSKLLASVWRTFDDITNEYDQRLEAIKAVAVFQPRQALDFVARQVRRKKLSKALPEILRRVAYTSDNLNEVFELLWELGKQDDRKLNPNPSHPIRVITELGDYGRGKPLVFNEALLAFGLKLAQDDRNWHYAHTPLDILAPLLALEGTDTTDNGRSFSISGFLVNLEVVRPLRSQVIDLTLAMLKHPNLKIAQHAASHVHDIVHLPTGVVGMKVPAETYKKTNAEIAKTLNRIEKVMTSGIHPLVALKVASAVAWHADHGHPPSSVAAKKVLDALPKDPEIALVATLTNSLNGIFVRRRDVNRWSERHREWMEQITASLRSTHPDPVERLGYLDQILAALTEAGEDKNNAHQVFGGLVRDDTPFALAMLDSALNSAAPSNYYAGIALAEILRTDRPLGRQYAEQLLLTGESRLMAAAASAYCGNSIEPDDDGLMFRFLSSPDAAVVDGAIRALWLWEDRDPKSAIRLLLTANIGQNTHLADELAMAFTERSKNLAASLDEEDANQLLKKFLNLPELSGHWLDEFLAVLSFTYPIQTAAFFMRRVEIAAQQQSLNFRAANYGPWSQAHLRFLETEAGPTVLSAVWSWLLENQDKDLYFQYPATHAFEAMFMHHFDEVVSFLRLVVAEAKSEELHLVGRILREAHHTFVFTHHSFVIELLERCQSVEAELVEEISQQLYAAAVSGMRSGTPGEPMPRDLEDRDKANAILSSLSLISPAYELYEWIRKSAEGHIEEARLDAEALDDD